MKFKKIFFFIFFAMFVAGSLTVWAQPKVIKVSPMPVKPPIPLLLCPDIQVSSFSAQLESTQVGTQTDFPHDTVRVLLELKNGGTVAVPPGTVLHIVFKRNEEVVKTIDLPNGLGDKGSRVAMGIDDSFPHDLKTTYYVEVTAPIQECSTSNNKASFTIDESQLHPSGAPDLTCSMFTAEKHWTHEGDVLKGTCYFAADVENIGSGYCRDDSKSLDLQFYSTTNKMTPRAYVRIPKSNLPGPGAKKRFSVEVPDSQVPPGKSAICAFLPPADDETNKANNWSTNSAMLDNSAVPTNGTMARIKFPPWGMTGSIVNVHIQIQNMQYQTIPSLRLILLKNDAIIKEWKPIELAPAATIEKSTVDDRPEVERGPDPEQYKVILTTNQSDPNPPADQILDSKTRPLYYLDMAQGLLQNILQDSSTGLGASIKQQHSDITIHDNETQVEISPKSVYLQLKGNYRLKGGTHVGFTVKVWLKLHARNGNLVAEVIDKDVKFGSKLAEAILDIFTAGIYEGIKYGIEKAAEKALGNSMNLGNINGVKGGAIGVVLKDGYMYIYSPYST